MLNVITVAAVLTAMAVVPTGSRVVVIAPPWSEPDRVMNIVREAGGSLVNGGTVDWIVVAEGNSQGFARRLIATGAILVLDGRLAQACLKWGDS